MDNLTPEEIGCYVLCCEGAFSLEDALAERHRMIFSYTEAFIKQVWAKSKKFDVVIDFQI